MIRTAYHRGPWHGRRQWRTEVPDRLMIPLDRWNRVDSLVPSAGPQGDVPPDHGEYALAGAGYGEAVYVWSSQDRTHWARKHEIDIIQRRLRPFISELALLIPQPQAGAFSQSVIWLVPHTLIPSCTVAYELAVSHVDVESPIIGWRRDDGIVARAEVGYDHRMAALISQIQAQT